MAFGEGLRLVLPHANVLVPWRKKAIPKHPNRLMARSRLKNIERSKLPNPGKWTPKGDEVEPFMGTKEEGY